MSHIQIPVHPGCHTSIIGTLGDSSFYHGKDGLGDAPDDIPPDESLLKTQHGVSAIVDIAKKYSGEYLCDNQTNILKQNIQANNIQITLLYRSSYYCTL